MLGTMGERGAAAYGMLQVSPFLRDLGISDGLVSEVDVPRGRETPAPRTAAYCTVTAAVVVCCVTPAAAVIVTV